jgi:cyanophycin synthetase
MIKLAATSVYVGPNLYARSRAIRLKIDFGRTDSTRTVKDFGIAGWLDQHLPGIGERRGSALPDLTLGDILAEISLEIQLLAGCDVPLVALSRAASAQRPVEVVYGYETEEIGLEAGVVARELLRILIDDPDKQPDFDFAAELKGFIKFAQRRALGPSTGSLIHAAEQRGIPWVRLNDQSLVQLGHGKYQRRIEATITSMTSHIAVEIASNKQMTNRILSELGLPVPKQRRVYATEEAVRAAEKIGYPVVVKPLDANHGRGVAVNLTTPEEVAAAFDAAVKHSDTVLVESLILGLDHRLLVINGELVAAARRMPGHVVGDGTNTIAKLVEIINQDPRRGVGHEKVLTRLELDDQALRCLSEVSMTIDSIPPAGEIVMLRKTANLSTGGTSIDVTDIIHPDNRDMAVRAIKAVGLDVGGIDFLTTNIAESYRDTGGAICEVNAAPGFRMHVAPSEGQSRDAAGKVMDMLFPPGTPSRIPIATLTGTNGKTTTARMLAHIMKFAGHTVGLTTTDAVYINGSLTVKGDMTGPAAANMVLKDPLVDAAVLETARGGLVRAGLGYEQCDVGAVLNVTEDHLGLGGIDTLEELAAVKRIVVEVARDTAVLNADDPLVLMMADHTDAQHICYVTRDPSHTLVREHIRAGGRAVVLEQGLNGDQIVLYDKGAQIPLIWTHLIPATFEGKALHNVENAMFAAAMAHGLGKSLDDIRNGLRTFDMTFFQAPGRLNVFDEHGFRVILDYGHNPAAIKAMVDTVNRMAPKGKRITVLTMPGDRRDQDLVAIVDHMVGHFDHYILRQDEDLRGRADGEIPKLLEAALLAKGVKPEQLSLIMTEPDAVDAALAMARPNDLVLVFAENTTRSWKQIIYFGKDETGSPPAERPALETAQPLPDDDRIIRDSRGVRLRDPNGFRRR